MKSSLEKLFKLFNDGGIRYCVLRKYQNLPEKINGDIDILVENKDFNLALGIIEEESFIYYPFTEPHHFFFKHDLISGLIKLDMACGRVPKRRKFKNFFVPESNREIRIKKGFSRKIWTRLRRTTHYFLKGKLICLIGPDGCGKSTIANEVLRGLEGWQMKKELIYFGTKREGKVYRTFDLVKKIWRAYVGKLLGRVIFTDRYIYLTFRNRPLINKFVKFLSPKPDKVYLLRASVQTILERKKELSINQIKGLYEHYSKINDISEIKNDGKMKENVSQIINEVLNLYKKE
jgi:thymidylate kinase